MPISFIPKTGQATDSSEFMAMGMGGTLHFGSDGVVLSLPALQNDVTNIRLSFEAANPGTVLRGEQPLQGQFHLFAGNDPTEWQTNIPSFANLTYSQLYEGIDLTYDGTDGTLKGTYFVDAGADPEMIRWQVTGATNLSIDPISGDLNMTTSENGEQLTERAPIAWQHIGATRVPVNVRYVLHGSNGVGFQVDSYNQEIPLIIDPTLVYSTFIGSSRDQYGHGVAVDSAGNIIVTGQIFKPPSSFYFPIVNAIQPIHGGERCGPQGAFCPDIFVTKYNAAGDQILFSTYIGGSGHDIPFGLALDDNDDIYIAGVTRSFNFPTSNAVYPSSSESTCFEILCSDDAFVLKLESTGEALIYSTFLGGTLADGANDITVHAAGNAYITGSTRSEDFPTANALEDTLIGDVDAFITIIDAAGSSLTFSSYMGGTGFDEGSGIAVDYDLKIFMAGRTTSSDFPTVNAFQGTKGSGISSDGFALVLDSLTSTITYSTYFGGPEPDTTAGIEIDNYGKFFLTGRAGTGFPTTTGAFDRSFNGIWDTFVAKFDPSATGSESLIYSTYLGGAREEEGVELTALADGTVYVTGFTESPNFPIADALYSSINSPTDDIFITRLTPDGASLIFSTYFGGENFDRPFDIVHDMLGNIYLVGGSESDEAGDGAFPITANGYQAGGSGVFLSIITPTWVLLDLSGSQPSAVEGDQLNYRLTLTNTGLVARNNILVDVAIPEGLDFVSAVGDGSYNNGQWSLDSVAAESTAILEITVNVLPGTAGMTLITEAQMAQFSPSELYGTLDYSQAELFVGLVDLEIEKYVNNDVPSEDETITFMLVATNNSSLAATDVIVTDLLPNGLTFVSANAARGDYDAESGVWSLGSIDGHESVGLTLSATVDNEAGGTSITNTATISSAQTDTDNENNTSRQTITVLGGCPPLDTIVRASGPQVIGQTLSSDHAAISANGRFVAFTSQSTNLTANDYNNTMDVFIYDQLTCAIELVSISSTGVQANDYSWRPAISADGRYVAFESAANNLVPGDTNSFTDIFVHDRKFDRTTLVSISSSGEQTDEYSFWPDISDNGRYVAFSSVAGNLDPRADDYLCPTDEALPGIPTQHCRAIYVHDRWTNQTSLVSVTASGEANNARSDLPVLSADGRFVAFNSYATNLVENDTNEQNDVFVHDRKTGRTWRISADENGAQLDRNSSSPAIAAGGRYITYQSIKTNSNQLIFVYDMATGDTALASVTSDGQTAFGTSLFPDVSADGRYVVFYSDAPNLQTSGLDQVIRHDMKTGENMVVSIAHDGVLGDRESINPSISDDGSYIAFRSEAENLVPEPVEQTTYIYLRKSSLVVTPLVYTDLQITQNVSHNPIYVSDIVTYSVEVTNQGPSSATNTVLTSSLPTGTTIQSATFDDGVCSIEATSVRCDLGIIPNTDTVTVSIVVAVNSYVGSSLSSITDVWADEVDPNTWNNAAKITTTLYSNLVAPELIAEPISNSAMNLSWTDHNVDETVYRIERTLSGEENWVEIAVLDAGMLTTLDNGLTCNTNYDYRVRAFRTGDNAYSAYSPVATASTLECDLQPPSITTITPAPGLRINIEWSEANVDETANHIERSLSGESNWTEIAVVTATELAYEDHGLACGTMYDYRLRAFRSIDGLYSNYSTVVSASTLDCPPHAPSELSSTVVNYVEVDLVWIDNSPDETEFLIERSPDGLNDWQEIASVAANETTYRDTALGCGDTYSYRVRAFRTVAESYSAFSNVTTVTTECHPLVPPDDLAVELVDTLTASLTWNDSNSFEQGYAVEKRFQSGQWIRINNLPADTTNYVDTDLKCFGHYEYRVAAHIDDEFFSDYSENAVIETNCFEPSPPDFTSTSALSRNSIALEWTLDIQSEPNIVHVERSEDGAIWSKIANLPANHASYMDTNLNCNHTYWYRLYTFRLFDNRSSDYSTLVNATTVSCPNPVMATVGLHRNGIWRFQGTGEPDSSSITFDFGPRDTTWLPVIGDWNGDGADGIGIYRNGAWVIRDVRDNGPVERAFRFGPAEPGWLPLAGDWNGDDIDGIGLYKDGVFLLRQTASDGPPEMTFRYGASEPGWRPVAGDWNGSGNSTVGLYKEGLWLLSNTLPAIADVRPIRFGRAGWTPVVGDWDQNGTTTIGVFRAGVWELSNVNAGISPDTIYSNGIREEGWQPLTNYQGSHAALQLLGSTPHNPLSSPTPTSSPVAQMTEPGTETPTEASKPEDGTLTTTPTKVELTEEVLATADPSPMPILPSETPSVLTTLTTTVPPDTTAVPTATTEPSTMTPVMASEVEG